MASSCRGVGVDRQVRPVAAHDELTLVLDCQPAEAEVKIDGVWQGSCELLREKRLSLAAGEHTLEISASGYRRYLSQVEGRGVLQKISISLEAQTP